MSEYIYEVIIKKDVSSLTTWEEERDFLFRIGLSIKKYRCIAGLSQEQLSALIECDKNTVGNIERGERDSRLTTLYHLAKGLGVNCSRLIRDTESASDDSLSATIDYDYLRLFQYCRKLTPEQFNTLCNTAHLFANSNDQIITGK